ncbi:hypothetical protein [Microvirga alba]|uniref:Uncharacterized protein n=1 Tax=Microvirga alba TaxID=2791025 RepID=A0A931BWH0_9HYPH|nr:hypothetical protein [Microvirga alba]MBF9235120.1 hypothetical protein [Microvirga alba]
MTLLERSEQLSVEVGEINALGAIAHQAEAIRSRATQFENVLAELRLCAGSARQLRDRGIEIEAEVQAVAGVRHFLSQLLDAVTADPAAILGAKDIQPKMLVPLGKIASSLQEAANQAWGRYVRQRLPAVSSDLLDALNRVPALRPKVEHFRGLRDRALASAARTPSKAAEFDVMEVLTTQCNEAWRDLDARDIPQDVLVLFREAATPRGAGLSKLTPSVLTWLEEHRLAEAFGIRIR